MHAGSCLDKSRGTKFPWPKGEGGADQVPPFPTQNTPLRRGWCNHRPMSGGEGKERGVIT